MASKTVSVAVIGAGMAGRTHANAWRQVGTVFGTDGVPNVRLAAICDAYLPFAEAAAKSYGYERATAGWHDIVAADDIDIVSIVVANRLHREIAEALVKAGKHVLCEKPLTDNLEDAKAMAEIEAGADVVTGIGFGYRRHPSIAEIAKLADGGALGQVMQFEGRYWCDYGADPNVPIAWRYKGPMGSGALGDVGSHITDVAEFICGPIKAVNGGTFATVIDKRPRPSRASPEDAEPPPAPRPPRPSRTMTSPSSTSSSSPGRSARSASPGSLSGCRTPCSSTSSAPGAGPPSIWPVPARSPWTTPTPRPACAAPSRCSRGPTSPITRAAPRWTSPVWATPRSSSSPTSAAPSSTRSSAWTRGCPRFPAGPTATAR